MEENNLKSAVEALIFASEKPITAEQIKKVLGDLDSLSINKIIAELKNEYAAQNRGIRVVEIAGGFQMTTCSNFAPFLKKLFKNRYSDKLSRPALESLAIIAYKQPLTKAEIESLRNVNVDGVMKSLADKNLIRICGRKKIPGRPFVYGTTREFLEHFGLKSLQDLPKMEDFTVLAQQQEAGETIELISQTDLEAKNESGQIA
ncbi:MAG: SMC-Scp complex subunit ScpB [Candidatus Omnitrophica bacterium]|nr:SMC-Scp complex subunit ScpB [Candidatus Omnitrophota bacterium]MBU4303404.1 SMC-Scp complex subunit ScpB [Candidatus Omnitrophota bacterium]MBU4418528.1 SMC-Scp complex subunit ScpB [Candidatus Omnitrophota bacterium]MBU4468790.1 SMC-Scp complex subunit ScpB [Candidatus Omnitrophota bacterium]MCG2708077.1 SMC-Scp complex subunit ScpB [Candidatus Omnitrophota bacterium]